MSNILPGEWNWMKTGTDVSGMPTDDATAQLMLKRRLAQADALRQMEVPQGQMISGHYVAPSWTQQLAALGGQWLGGKQEEQAIKGYQDYLSAQQKTKQDALTALSKALSPQAITEQSSYDIQVPNGKQAGATDNLGGMQPYESGMKTISVPMTTTTGTRNPTAQDVISAISAYSNATKNPDLAEKLIMTQAGQIMAPKQTEWKEVNGKLYGFDVHGNPTGKTLGEGKKEKPQFETFREGTNQVTYQIMPDGTRIKVASGVAFAPEKGEPDPLHLNDTQPNKSKVISPGLAKGKVVNGYVYMGGDPNQQSSWRKQ